MTHDPQKSAEQCDAAIDTAINQTKQRPQPPMPTQADVDALTRACETVRDQSPATNG
jgi:hypothetical protein